MIHALQVLKANRTMNAAGVLIACGLFACSGAPGGEDVERTSDAVTSQSIASVALANVGLGACSTNSDGSRGFASSCNGNGGQPEYWCADFARWVWAAAGTTDTAGLSAAAGSFYVYGETHGTLSTTPAVGDAVVFNYHGNGSADHVAIVTQVNANGTIETASGDWGGYGNSEAAFSSTSHVVLNAPAYGWGVGTTPGEMGMTISGFIAPAGLTTGPVTPPAPTVPALGSVRGVARDASGGGYWIVADDGGVFTYGNAAFYGSEGGHALNSPVVGMASAANGGGYLLAASDGGVFTFGDVGFHGSMGGTKLNKPVVGAALTPSGDGYWLVASDGGIFAFGDAPFEGSMGGKALNQPIVGMASTPSGNGYWLVASDGGIFAFGDAPFEGSLGSTKLNKPVVGMSRSPSGNGYWLVASDGGVFAFGDAGFHGSMGGKTLNQPVMGIAATPSGAGYWLVAADGGIFAFGDAPFEGSDAK
jgi:hypothetical protein